MTCRGVRSPPLKKGVSWHDIKLRLMVSLQYWSSRECAICRRIRHPCLPPSPQISGSILILILLVTKQRGIKSFFYGKLTKMVCRKASSTKDFTVIQSKMELFWWEYCFELMKSIIFSSALLGGGKYH